MLSALSACCGCLKYCCCESSSSQKEEGESKRLSVHGGVTAKVWGFLVFLSKSNCRMTSPLGSSWKILLQRRTPPLNHLRMKPALWSVCDVYRGNGLAVRCLSSPLLMSFFYLQMQTPSVTIKSSEVCLDAPHPCDHTQTPSCIMNRCGLWCVSLH